MNMGIDKRLCITVPEAAEMMGISRNFAYELVKQGKLPVIKFGKAKELLKKKFGKFPQCLIVVAKLHFMEEEALKKYKV